METHGLFPIRITAFPRKKEEKRMKLTKNDWFGAGKWMGLKLELIFGLGLCLLSMALGNVAGAQAISTTTVQGTVYLANGQVGAGTLMLRWPAFTTANGQSVAADSITVTIAPDGFVSVNLAPNLGATPAGLYYTAVYYLADGTTTTQYWVVPAAAQASLAQVQAQLMPAAQAVQAVSKAYVDQSIAEVEGSLLLAAGGTLSGPLYLNGDPTQPLQAADKHYVDTTFSEAVPLAGGNMTGALQTPAMNGEQSPLAGSSQTTLQAAINAAGSNGAVVIPPTYAGTDGFTNSNGVYVKDLRRATAQQQERSVKEFGAVCDGATDDTNALQAALNYANANGVTLTIPQGTCKTRSLNWRGESIGGLGKQVSALMGFPGQDVLATGTDSVSLLSYTRIHDLTIYVDQSADISCSAAEGRAAAGMCAVSRLMEKNSIFSPGGNGLTGTQGTGTAWAVGNCAIAMPAATGSGGNGLRVAEIENLEIATTGVDPMAAQYPGAHSTHTCGLYLAQWPQWSEFRNIDIRGLNTGIAIPALPVAAPAGLNSDSNRWQNITIQATHAFTAGAGSNNVLDNVVAMVGNSAATGEPPTGLVLDLAGTQQGWTVRNAVVLPTWSAVQPQLTVTASGGAVTGVTAGPELGLGFDPYGTQIPLKFSGSCTAQAVANVNNSGAIGTVSVTQGGVGCSGTTTATVNVQGTWDTAAPVNLIAGQNMTFFAGNLLKGNGGYTVWSASSSQSNGTQLDGGGGNLPGGGTYAALVANNPLGTALQVDQFPGADFGARLQACLGAVSATFGGTCDARNFTGSLSMGSNLTISTANTAVLLPCATISTANQVIVTAGTRNVSLRGCALRGGSAASGSQGGTAFLYSGTGAMVQVGDPTYAADTSGFHMEDLVINTTAASSATAQGLVAYRTQELDLESLYFLGNQNQTGMTLDGTGNYTGGTFFDDEFGGFLIAVNAIGHQIANAATTDWMNASAFVRLHIVCPTSGGSPIAGTYGINLQQGDGNTFTGGDVEGCNTAMHLGPNAQNNTIVGLRNENSNNQVVADAGSSYNNWMTGGTMLTGKLTDAGTRNSFLDTFHRSFNGLNGDWYGSQQDATVTNHFRLGIGLGNERGLQDRYQTDFGYRWTTGLSDATAGEQFYQVLDELNSVYRLSIGQYNNGQSSTNNQTVLNAAGTGAIVLNGSNNSGTGGVVFGSGGATETTVATIDHAGDAQFNGTLLVAGTSQSTGTMTVRNNSDSEVDYYLWPGLTASQKGSFTYKDWNGNSQWYMVKDASNNWSLNSALGGLDSFKAYQSTNSGDTYINASNSTGVVRVNYETGAGAGFNVYGGSSSSLYASFTGAAAIKFPGLAAGSGHNCVQIDTSGYITNTGSACGTSSGGGSGTVSSATSGQIAYYTGNGTSIGGMSQVTVSAGGTGASTASGALASLGAQAAIAGLTTDGLNGIVVPGNGTFGGAIAAQSVNHVFLASAYSGSDCGAKINTVDGVLGSASGTIQVDPSCGTSWTTQVVLSPNHNLQVAQGGTYVLSGAIKVSQNNIIDLGGSTFQIGAYSTGSPTQRGGMIQTYTVSGTAVATDVTIQNGVMDGNLASTPSGLYCYQHIYLCSAAIEINSNNNGVNATHGITIKGIKFQNWNSQAIGIQGLSSYPLPYDIYILDNKFLNIGGDVIGSSGWDHHMVIRGNVFSNWGTGTSGPGASGHADVLQTYDFTGYPGTSGFDLDFSDNIVSNTVISAQGVGYVTEIGAGGLGWVRNFTFSNNHMNDNGTGSGNDLSGTFWGATVTGNTWTTQCPDELIGTNITMTGNTCQNGTITIGPPNYFSGINNNISNNTISEPGLIGAPWTETNQKAIVAGGSGPLSSPITQVIRQSAVSFTAAGGSLTTVTFQPRVSATPPSMVVAGMTGLTANQYQNWAFTLACANNGGNDGTFIVYSNTATTMTFVNPFAVAETLPSTLSYCAGGATLTSLATTAVYIGNFDGAGSDIAGSFNGMVGIQNLTATNFSNTGNNVTNATVLGNSMTAIAISNSSAVSATYSTGTAWTLSVTPILQNTMISHNSIDLQNASLDCAGITLGRGDGGRPGQVIGTTVTGNMITSSTLTSGAGSTCRGIDMNSQSGIATSLDTNILDNDISNVGLGIYQEDSFMSFNDVTVRGNKFNGVIESIDFTTPPAVLREDHNILNSTDTLERLQGGVTVDASGDITSPGQINAGTTVQGGALLAGNGYGTVTPGNSVAVFRATDSLSTTRLLYAANLAGNAYLMSLFDDGGLQLAKYASPTGQTYPLLIDQNGNILNAGVPLISTAAGVGTVLNSAEYSILYSGGPTAAPLGLAGNTSTTKCFVQETGTGSAAQAPGCAALGSTDIPNNAANTTGNAATATTAGQVNGAAPPTSAARLATNSSGQIVAAANTLGCLDGYDHLPCTVYVQSTISESSPTGTYATAWTSAYAGLYRVTGITYGTTASSTAYTVTSYVKALNTGGSANGYTVATAQIGTSISSGNVYPTLFNLAAGVPVQTESAGSGTNTGGVWSRGIVIERLQ